MIPAVYWGAALEFQSVGAFQTGAALHGAVVALTITGQEPALTQAIAEAKAGLTKRNLAELNKETALQAQIAIQTATAALENATGLIAALRKGLKATNALTLHSQNATGMKTALTALNAKARNARESSALQDKFFLEELAFQKPQIIRLQPALELPAAMNATLKPECAATTTGIWDSRHAAWLK